MVVATAVLTAPRMEVTSLGDALQVQFERLPVTAFVKVTVWRRGYEQQVRPSSVPGPHVLSLFLRVSSFPVSISSLFYFSSIFSIFLHSFGLKSVDS